MIRLVGVPFIVFSLSVATFAQSAPEVRHPKNGGLCKNAIEAPTRSTFCIKTEASGDYYEFNYSRIDEKSKELKLSDFDPKTLTFNSLIVIDVERTVFDTKKLGISKIGDKEIPAEDPGRAVKIKRPNGELLHTIIFPEPNSATDEALIIEGLRQMTLEGQPEYVQNAYRPIYEGYVRELGKAELSDVQLMSSATKKSTP